MAYCTHCGKVSGTEDEYCSRCGGRLWDGRSPAPFTVQVPIWQPSPKKTNEELVIVLVIIIVFIAVSIAVPYVLYMMVMGFGEGSQDTPTVSLSTSESGSPHQEKVLIADISSPIKYEDLSITLIINGSANFAPVHPGDVFIGTDQNSGYLVKFVDLQMDSRVGGGDYFLVTNPAGTEMAGTEIYLVLLYGTEKVAISTTSWACK